MYVQRGPHFQCAVLLWGTVFPVHDIAVKPIPVPAFPRFDETRAWIGTISSSLLAGCTRPGGWNQVRQGRRIIVRVEFGSAQPDGHCAAWRGGWYCLGAPI